MTHFEIEKKGILKKEVKNHLLEKYSLKAQN
jgi:hypothetical protein